MRFGETATADEHLAACRERALTELEHGGIKQAILSLASDVRKHPETVELAIERLAAMHSDNGKLSTDQQVRDFINSFQ